MFEHWLIRPCDPYNDDDDDELSFFGPPVYSVVAFPYFLTTVRSPAMHHLNKSKRGRGGGVDSEMPALPTHFTRLIRLFVSRVDGPT